MSDLVKHLREAAKSPDTVNWCDTHAVAADEIERLQARVEELEDKIAEFIHGEGLWATTSPTSRSTV